MTNLTMLYQKIIDYKEKGLNPCYVLVSIPVYILIISELNVALSTDEKITPKDNVSIKKVVVLKVNVEMTEKFSFIFSPAPPPSTTST